MSKTRRRTQAERRAETYQQVMDSACKVFGDKGYNDASIEEISAHSGVSSRPIYHYFGSKKALFDAACEVMEERILEVLSPGEPLIEQWEGFLGLCDDPAFRRITLIDGPNVLGRSNWVSSRVNEQSLASLSSNEGEVGEDDFSTQLKSRMIYAALGEVALQIAEADDVETAKQQATEVVRRLFETFFPGK